MTIQPAFRSQAFQCPFCNVHAHMGWSDLYEYQTSKSVGFVSATCAHCGLKSVWYSQLRNSIGMMIYPDKVSVSAPAPDMPEDVLEDYNEAALIYSRSPRGAAALLRLALQKLCKHLGQPGERIDQDIRNLAKENVLPPMIVKVADTVRITGNNAVHPGEMSDEDFDHVAAKMFDLINIIVDKGISEPKVLDALYNLTPEDARKAAEAKDAKAREKPKG